MRLRDIDVPHPARHARTIMSSARSMLRTRSNDRALDLSRRHATGRGSDRMLQ